MPKAMRAKKRRQKKKPNLFDLKLERAEVAGLLAQGAKLGCQVEKEMAHLFHDKKSHSYRFQAA